VSTPAPASPTSLPAACGDRAPCSRPRERAPCAPRSDRTSGFGVVRVDEIESEPAEQRAELDQRLASRWVPWRVAFSTTSWRMPQLVSSRRAVRAPTRRSPRSRPRQRLAAAGRAGAPSSCPWS
jgi:hypothetical protein